MARIVGFTLPISKSSGGWFAPKGPREVIKASIGMLLGTRVGERLMEPEYGCRLAELVFEQSDEVFVALAQSYVVDSIRRWENRITLIEPPRVLLPFMGGPEASMLTEHQAKITLRYVINAQSTEDNLDFVMNRGA